MPVLVRPAVPRDLPALQGLEDAADRMLFALLGADAWESAPTGEERAAQPGLLLVAEDAATASVVGFVHVLEVDDEAHLEQVSVLPKHGRQRIGTRLVEATVDEARERGYVDLTLRTYADVAFNAPFYARLGFEESQPATAFQLALIDSENKVRLDRVGRRIQMTKPLI